MRCKRAARKGPSLAWQVLREEHGEQHLIPVQSDVQLAMLLATAFWCLWSLAAMGLMPRTIGIRIHTHIYIYNRLYSYIYHIRVAYMLVAY